MAISFRKSGMTIRVTLPARESSDFRCSAAKLRRCRTLPVARLGWVRLFLRDILIPRERFRIAPGWGVESRSVAVQYNSAPARMLGLEALSKRRHLPAELGELVPWARGEGLGGARPLLRRSREGAEPAEGTVEAAHAASCLEVHLQGPAHVAPEEVRQRLV